jgi:hypothetical protein
MARLSCILVAENCEVNLSAIGMKLIWTEIWSNFPLGLQIQTDFACHNHLQPSCCEQALPTVTGKRNILVHRK